MKYTPIVSKITTLFLCASMLTASCTFSSIRRVRQPEALQELERRRPDYTAQVLPPHFSILQPHEGETLNSNKVEVRFRTDMYELFKDQALGMGNHLHFILDNEPYKDHFTTEPLIYENVPQGTHTIRAFAVRPWHESYKKRVAFAMVTFEVKRKTNANAPNPAKPLLTYSCPPEVIGAEPILLDFWLLNTELSPDGTRLKYTINGETGFVNRWEPIYLSGWKEGENRITLTLIDGRGAPIENRFNHVECRIKYGPGGNDILSKLKRGELSADDAQALVGRSSSW